MSVQDFVKKSILESGAFDQATILEICLGLLTALLAGALIYLIYSQFYVGVIYSRSFAITLVGMTVLTAMVTLAISTNIVISLGMVGALSIVRFRTAIKDPLDLLYLFWAITSGIAAGAQMYILVVVSAVIMILLIVFFRKRQLKGRIYIAVIHYTGEETVEQVIRTFGKIKYFIKSQTVRKDTTEMAVELFFKKYDPLFLERLRAVEGVQDATLIQYNGEYHG